MGEDKELIRHWLKSKRMALDKESVSAFSQQICDKLIELLNWEAFKTVHCYEAIESLNEVHTQPLLDYLAMKDIIIYLQDKSPRAQMPSEKLDLIIVPTLGFDGRGNRMGWGGGYYDKLLNDQSKALKVGLCYENGLVIKGLPTEPHDIPLSIVVTELKVRKMMLKLQCGTPGET